MFAIFLLPPPPPSSGDPPASPQLLQPTPTPPPPQPSATAAKVDRQPERGHDLRHPALMSVLSGRSRERQGGVAWSQPLPAQPRDTEEPAAQHVRAPFTRSFLLTPLLQPTGGVLGSTGFSTTWLLAGSVVRSWPERWLCQDSCSMLRGCATSQKRTDEDTPSSCSPLPAMCPNTE